MSSATVIVFFVLSSVSAEESISDAGKSIQQFDLQIENRQIKGKLNKIKVTEDEWVSLKWYTDETVNLHLHGYDIKQTVTVDAPAVMEFRSRATGRFPITAHGFGEHQDELGTDHHAVLLYLEVYPK
ncbi:hypothetical protein L4D76_16845 [Photobacterium sagamiensis]|uniref:hypothetical protein n=1 Tax=Photobacterium sagamiensis TaxID=2910241 RepID=UPI003D0D606D